MGKELRAEQLRTKREAAGLTVRMLSIYAGISDSAIYNYERGLSRPSRRIREKLKIALTSKRVRKPLDTCRVAERVIEPSPPPPKFKFEEGQMYSIRDYDLMGSRSANWINPQYGTLCEFRYEGKRGVHHCFVEARGGWTRTYTDAQLIGKKIEEVRR